ncbi:MAG: translation initiation factor 5A [Candidatus Micrarchaeota archaeon]|nr:MAG: translation initiation factor 5A [Candidatus Micrarchaeota archaeon]
MAELPETKIVSAKELKKGGYIVIDGEPCRIVEIDVSSPGKHGAAKMRITALSIFTGSKKSIIKPSDADAEVPTVEKKKAQVVSVTNDTAQLMDSDTYEVYELPIPEDLKGSISSGMEVEVIQSMGRRALSKVLNKGE